MLIGPVGTQSPTWGGGRRGRRGRATPASERAAQRSRGAGAPGPPSVRTNPSSPALTSSPALPSPRRCSRNQTRPGRASWASRRLRNPTSTSTRIRVRSAPPTAPPQRPAADSGLSPKSAPDRGLGSERGSAGLRWGLVWGLGCAQVKAGRATNHDHLTNWARPSPLLAMASVAGRGGALLAPYLREDAGRPVSLGAAQGPRRRSGSAARGVPRAGT